jgi:Na+/proline symporter
MTGGLGSVFLLGLATKKANGAGVLIGLIVSAVVQYFVGIYKPFNLLLYTASGFITCFVFGYLFSWLLPMYDKPLEGLTVYSYSPEKEK